MAGMGPDQTQVQPIGRINDLAPGGAGAVGAITGTSPEAAPTQSPLTSLPTLNPADSPYQPLNLPSETPNNITAGLPPEEPIRNLGAVSHAGAVAYLADQVLRGAMQGIQAHREQQAAQFNKKLSAQQQLYNDQAQQLYQMAKAGVDPQSQEYKDAYNRTLTAWQATMQSIGGQLPQQGQGGTAGGGKKGKAPSGMDALQAVYQGAISTGPPVFHQIAPMLTPEYRAKVGVGAATQGATAQAGLSAAQAESQLEALKAEREKLLAKPDMTEDDQARVRQINQALVSPMQHLTTAQSTRYFTDDKGARWQYQVNASGEKIEGTDRPVAGAPGKPPAPPKPIKYDNTTGTVADVNTGKVYFPGALDLPVDVASMFKAADNQTFKKQQLALQKIAASGNARLQSNLGSKVVQAVDPQNPDQTIWMRAIDAVRQGAPTATSVWYKMQMPTGQERARADLAISAREQLNTMAGILQKRADLFGPESGRATDFTKWVGSQDPDAQRFAAAAKIASDHLAGVFGGRSKEALQGIYDAIGQNKTNPAAAMAALEQMNVAAAQIQGRGMGRGAVPTTPTASRTAPNPTPTAPAAAPSAAPSGPVTVVDPNGKSHQFATQAQADHFKQLAGIK